MGCVSSPSSEQMGQESALGLQEPCFGLEDGSFLSKPYRTWATVEDPGEDTVGTSESSLYMCVPPEADLEQEFAYR